MEEKFDIIIIGAGAAGLMAAWELGLAGRSVAVLEARDRIGGRIHTIVDKNFELPVELGAEFIHGNLKLTQQILKKSKAEQIKLSGGIWQKLEGQLQEQKDFIEDYSALDKKFKELDHDISIAQFVADHLQDEKFEALRFTLKNYVEGYYAADTSKASTFALRDELNKPDEEQYRVEGGYSQLLHCLLDECRKKNVSLFLSHPVKEVNWKKDHVSISANNQSFHATKALVTVSIGVLQSEVIRFSPALSQHMAAARQLGFGPVIKTFLQFHEAFWKEKKTTQNKNLDKLSFMFSGSVVPTWWTYYPKQAAMLTGWSGGPHAYDVKDLDDESILQKALQSLTEIFDISMSGLQQQLKAWHVANWLSDPHTCGGYSYEVVNGEEAKSILKTPVENTLFFAGEGLVKGTEIGTVEAALKNGRETAHRIIGEDR